MGAVDFRSKARSPITPYWQIVLPRPLRTGARGAVGITDADGNAVEPDETDDFGPVTFS